jgi:hypothetical protein
VLDQRHELVKGGVVTPPPRDEQPGHLRRVAANAAILRPLTSC